MHCCSSIINFFLEQQFMQMYAQIMSNYLHRKWAKKLTRETKPWEFPFQSLGLITAEVFGRVRYEVANSDRHAISTA